MRRVPGPALAVLAPAQAITWRAFSPRGPGDMENETRDLSVGLKFETFKTGGQTAEARCSRWTFKTVDARSLLSPGTPGADGHEEAGKVVDGLHPPERACGKAFHGIRKDELVPVAL